MNKYRISWSEEVFYEIDIEAKNQNSALNKFSKKNFKRANVIEKGAEFDENSVEVEEVDEPA